MPLSRVLCVIPARFASTRLHGKPLLPVDGEPMIAHVIRAARAATSVQQVLVATDHDGIVDVARASRHQNAWCVKECAMIYCTWRNANASARSGSGQLMS